MADTDTEKFFAALAGSLEGGHFVKLTLAKPRAKGGELKNVYARPVSLRDGPRLSFLYRYRTRDETKNHTHAEAPGLLRALLGAEFLSGHLFTTRQDLRLELSRRGEARLFETAATFAGAAEAAEHDRRKRRAIETAGNVYLRELGVTNERGEVRPAMGDKLRQINKFVETVAGLHASSPLAGGEELSVVDMGSGKGYLTFAVYDYFNNVAGLRAEVTGVEARAELVELCDRIAREAGFARLRFQTGYRVKVFEFVSAEHTRKNTMIAAVRRRDAGADGEAARREFRSLKEFYGIREQRLEKLLRGLAAPRAE